MTPRKHVREKIVACGLLGTLLLATHTAAQLQPSDTLDQTTWQEAEGMMPDIILKHFQTGQHSSSIIAVPPEALRWGSRFNKATEANQGKYEINAKGIMIEKATGTWPRFAYGMPFQHIDPNAPEAPYQIMYNFIYTLVQFDDIDVFLNMFWVNPDGLERHIDMRGQALLYGARWSGPIPNPDEVGGKVLIYGVAPYDLVGLATLDWNYLDPEKWRSIWTYIPLIRRVRRLTAANSSDRDIWVEL